MLTVFDMVSRYLRYRGLEVTYVRNITDIDDKIIKRAAENGVPIDAVTSRFIQAMNEDAEALGLRRPDFEPRATEYVPNIIAMINQLIDRGYAYVAADGDVLYAVAKFEGYGKLSGKRLADLRAGARVEWMKPSAIRSTLCCGSTRNPASRRGIRRGIGAPRLAHRMLSHVHGHSGYPLRHPWRRHGSEVSSPRERDCPVLRGDRRPVREPLDAQRLRQHR